MKTKITNIIIAFAFITSGVIAGGSGQQDKTTFKADAKETSVKWEGRKVTGKTHHGTVKLKEGWLIMKGDQIQNGEFIIDMTTIVNKDVESEEYNKKLVGHLKSDDFFAVEKFPTAILEIKSAKKMDEKGAKEGTQKYELTGEITVRGISEPITFPATIVRSGENMSAVASFEFDRAKHEVKYGSGSYFDDLGDKMIEDMIKIEVTLRGKSK